MVAPAGGAWSLYTNWEQDGSQQWETFLSRRAAGLAGRQQGPGAQAGTRIVGAAQGGTGALSLAEFHPDRFRYAGSMSGFLNPSNTSSTVRSRRLMQFGGVDTNMWGLPQLGRWKWHDPTVHEQLLIDNNTRLWVFSPQTLTAQRPRRDDRLLPTRRRAATGRSTRHYRAIGGGNGALRLPDERGPRLGQLGGAARRDVGRTRVGDRLNRSTGEIPGASGCRGHCAAGTLEACSSR